MADIPCTSCCELFTLRQLSIAPCGHKFCGDCFEPGAATFKCPGTCGMEIRVDSLVGLYISNPEIYETIGKNINYIADIERKVQKARQKYDVTCNRTKLNYKYMVNYLNDYNEGNTEYSRLDADTIMQCFEPLLVAYDAAKKNLEVARAAIELMEESLPHFKNICAAPNFPDILFHVDVENDFALSEIGFIDWLKKPGLYRNIQDTLTFARADKFRARIVTEDNYNMLYARGGILYYFGREIIMVSNLGFARKMRWPTPIRRIMYGDGQTFIIVTEGPNKLCNLNDVEMRGCILTHEVDIREFDQYPYMPYRGNGWSTDVTHEKIEINLINWNIIYREEIVSFQDEHLGITLSKSRDYLMIARDINEYVSKNMRTIIRLGANSSYQAAAIDENVITIEGRQIKDIKYDKLEQKLYISVPYLPDIGQLGRLVVIEPISEYYFS